MPRLLSLLLFPLLLLTGCQNFDSQTGSRILQTLSGAGAPSEQTIASGLREALRVGAQRAVETASADNAYADNPDLRIQLPDSFQQVASTLRRVGYADQLDELEAKMNGAAEQAADQAVPVFAQAITRMSIADAKRILNGGDTAATDYFRSQTRDELASLYAPIVEAKLSELGVVRHYQTVMDRYRRIPFMKEPEFTLTDYVTDEALDGLFELLAQEEQRIRQDPAARTTQLLKQVFGSATR